ncbi:MAG TPA: Smr/MutS family protein [Sphingopyxis sp.]|nr:Smr/MutS family protein [Sphingopyxis sp.]
MARRILNPDEVDLWQRVAATVEPLHKRPPKSVTEAGALGDKHPPPPKLPRSPLHLPSAVPLGSSKFPAISLPPPRRTQHQTATLDGHWDRRLKKGHVRPDMALDLHGHTLASAQALLEDALGRALLRGARVLLVVAGRLRPGADSLRLNETEKRPRGAIRASLPDWLAGSAFADQIVALRPAHSSHGGAGAVYVILRRLRED